MASRNELIITMLPNSPHVKEAVLGKNGVIEGAKPGSVLVDMSSIAPLASREVAAELASKGVEMLDAPVSGGEPKAIDGTLAIMVGGKEAVFEKVKDVLLKMGASAVLCGDIGAGNVTKLANQIIVALNIAAMSEAFVLATKAGVDPERVFNAIKGGLAGSTVLNAKAPMVLAGKLQARIQDRAAHQGPAERARYGARDRRSDPAHEPGNGDDAGPQGRREAGRRPWQASSSSMKSSPGSRSARGARSERDAPFGQDRPDHGRRGRDRRGDRPKVSRGRRLGVRVPT